MAKELSKHVERKLTDCLSAERAVNWWTMKSVPSKCLEALDHPVLHSGSRRARFKKGGSTCDIVSSYSVTGEYKVLFRIFDQEITTSERKEMMAENPVRVVARVKAKPGNESELGAILSSMVEAARAEKGCLSYEMLENRSDPTDFTFVEAWSSDETLGAHLEGLQSNLPKLMDLLAEPPDIRTYTTVG